MEEFYCLTFNNVHTAIKAEKDLLQYFPLRLIPVPRKISATCGLALKIDKSHWLEAVTLIKDSIEFEQAFLITKESVINLELVSEKVDQ